MSEPTFDPFAGGEISRLCPTTAPQQEIITSSKMSDEANTAFNEAVSLRVNGTLEIALLESSLNALFERHDILNATFSSLGDEICLQPTRRFVLDYEDLRALDAAAKGQTIDALLKNIAISPMNLEEGPLFFAWVKQLEDESFELICAAHHVICDGWSIGLLLTELATIYKSGGDVNALPAAPSFFDFADQHAASQVSNADIDYWLKRFENLPPTLDLPLDRPRPPTRSFRAERYDYHLDQALVKALPKAASALKSSLVNYVLAGYFALLHRLTGNVDIVVGLPVAGQAALNQLSLVGHMVQLLPIRISLHGDTPFSELVASVKEQVLNASEHPNFTFGKLLENISVDRSRVPLISSIFNIDQPMPEIDFGTAKATLRSVPRAAENFEMFLNIMPSKDDLVIEATYSSVLFSEATMHAWLQSLEAILQAALQDSSVVLDELCLTNKLPAVVESINQTEKSNQFTDLVSAFKFRQQQNPAAIAVICGDQSLTYQQLDTSSSALATLLRKEGVREGAVVGICCERSELLLVSTLAVLKTGAAYLPLDPDFPQERLIYMLEDSQAVAVIEDASAPQGVRDAALKHISTDELSKSNADQSAFKPVSITAEQLAYTIYTSGSTGKPKGVRVQHSAVINFLESMAVEPGLTEADRLLAVTTLSFDISVLELFLPIVCGAATVVATRDDIKDGERLAALIEQHGVSVMQATPSTWRMLLLSKWRAAAASGQPKLRALCGGEPLPADLAKELLPQVAELWNMFGPTETTVWSTCKRINYADSIITVGTPIANTRVYVLDSKLKPLPVSAPGELCIAGAGVTLGYHNRPELNADRFVEHPEFGRLYRTGDLAKVLPSGELQHLGRLDDQVKLRGYRIELGDIEAALQNSAEVEQAAVYLWEINEQDVRIVACCVPPAGKSLETIALRKQLRNVLPSYMLPQYFLSIAAVPLTPNGKIDRRSLPRPEVVESSILGEKTLHTNTEKQIAQVWVDLLKPTGAIGREDNFFEIGGHSLLALEAIRRIETVTGARLTPTQLVAERLVTLAAKVDAAGEQQQDESMPVALPQSAARRLSLEQSRLLQRQLKVATSTCNNLPAAWLLEGDIDLEALRTSLQRVFERQTALRTRIVSGEHGYQLALRHMSDVDVVEIIDLAGEAQPLEAALAAASLSALQPFPVVDESLCRATLYKVGATTHLLTLTPHQLIFDGWSFDIFLRELESYYQAALENRAATLQPLPFQFRDYTEWSAEQLIDESTLAFHQRLLDSNPPQASFVDSNADKSECRRRELHFGTDTLRSVEGFCERHNVRLHELLLAVLAKACCDHDQRSELLIGLPVTGRYIPEVIGLIGSFVSMLPLQLQLRVGNFAGMVQDVAEQLRVFHDHQELSFAECVKGTALEGQPFPGLLEMSFAFQDVRNRPQSLANLKLSQIDMARLQTEVPLELWTRVQPNGLLVVFDYDSGQVEESAIDSLANAVTEIATSLDTQEQHTPPADAVESTSPDVAKPFWKRLFQ